MLTNTQAEKIRGLEEAEIADILAMQTLERERAECAATKISEFTAKRTSGRWIVEFTYSRVTGERTRELTYTDYKVIAQRGGIRQFFRLTGVQSWMEKMNVPEFKIIL